MKWLIAMLVTVVSVGLIAPLCTAQDAKSEATVAGKWRFVLNTEGGDRTVDADFQQDGNNVTGKFGKDDAKGTIEGGKLKMEFLLNSEEAGPGTMKLTGEVTHGSIKGDWEFQSYSGTYKASRIVSAQ